MTMKNVSLSKIIAALAILFLALVANASENIQVSPGLSPEQQKIYDNNFSNYDAQAREVIGVVSEKTEDVLRTKQQPRTCPEQYQGVLQSPNDSGDVYLHIAIGYIDDLKNKTGLTEDLIAFEILNEWLIKPCRTSRLLYSNTTPVHQLCGFEAISNSFDGPGKSLLVKELTMPNAETRRVVLAITASSVTPLDRNNRQARKNEQDDRSMEAHRLYYDALNFKNVVLYLGHSRKGSGPDFFPYAGKASKENIEKVKTTLKSARHRPAIVGFFSCDSANHFSKLLEDAVENSTRLFMTTKLTKTPFKTLLTALNGIMTFQCQDELSNTLDRFDGEIVSN